MSRSMRCGRAQDLLPEFLGQGLDKATRSMVREHLRDCSRCRKAGSEWLQARKALRASGLDPPPDRKPLMYSKASTTSSTTNRRNRAVVMGRVAVADQVYFSTMWDSTFPASRQRSTTFSSRS